jgi:nucleotide-binding universal stress UspA family protein
MSDQQTILVPIDYRPQSMAAYEYARIIAKATQCSLTLLYVIEETGIFTKNVLSKAQREEIIHKAENRLKELIANDQYLKENNIKAFPVIKKGKVYRKIINLSSEIKPRLIIMGRTDSSDFRKNITGTNTHHIVSEAKTPVITIKGSHEVTTDDHILLPLDLTHPVKEKIAKTIEMAEFLGAKVTVLAVLQSNWLSKRIKFQKSLDEIKKIFTKYEITCDTQLKITKDASIYKIINEFAEKINADLIMMMTQQEMNIHQYFIGSTAQEIINNSELPVLTIIPHPEMKMNIKHYLFHELVDPLQVYRL